MDGATPLSDIEKVIGANIRENRERKAITQSDLGEQVAERLGRPWPRQAISAAEKGGRSFTAAEVLAFADALDTKPGDLFEPTSESEPLAMAVTLVEECYRLSERARVNRQQYTQAVHEVVREARRQQPLRDAIYRVQAQWQEAFAGMKDQRNHQHRIDVVQGITALIERADQRDELRDGNES